MNKMRHFFKDFRDHLRLFPCQRETVFAISRSRAVCLGTSRDLGAQQLGLPMGLSPHSFLVHIKMKALLLVAVLLAIVLGSSAAYKPGKLLSLTSADKANVLASFNAYRTQYHSTYCGKQLTWSALSLPFPSPSYPSCSTSNVVLYSASSPSSPSLPNKIRRLRPI